MVTHHPRIPLLFLVGVLSACTSDAPVGPDLQPGVRTVEVTPRAATLSLAGERTVQLEVLERIEAGAPTPAASAGPVTFKSSNLSIAEVSSKGVVTALAPGEATIEASVTRGSRTYTASMAVTVTTTPLAEVELSGAYELTAVISTFDPAWGSGDFSGQSFTADLTLQGGGASGISGYFANMIMTGPGVSPGDVGSTGLVKSQFDGYGREHLSLKRNDGDPKGPFTLDLWVAAKTPDYIRGTFGCCGHIGGQFEIQRK